MSNTQSRSLNYKRIFELSPDLYAVADDQGYFIEVSQSFFDTLGYTRKDLLETVFMDFIHSDDAEATENIYQRLLKGERCTDFENRYRHKDGHYLLFRWSAQLDHETGFIYAVARDVTREKNQEQELKQLERVVSEASIYSETNADGVITRANEAFCKLSGYSEQELIGNTHRMVNSGTHPESFFERLWHTISGKNIWSGLIVNRKKNGALYYVHAIIAPIFNYDGEITKYISIRHDITESVMLKKETTRLLGILNDTNAIAKIGGWELDVDSGELTWTDETFRILEVEKQPDQKPILPEGIQLFVPEHQSVIETAVERAISHGEPYSLELQAQTAKGNVLWVHTDGQAHYERGKVTRLSGTIQDIEAKKNMEIQFNLERQKSIQSSKLASLGELAASMAHEINNPLGIISGYSELLGASQNLDQSQRDKLEAIVRSCDRIAHIVSNLRKFSRKSTEPELKPCCLAEIIEEAITLTKPRLKSQLVTLEFTNTSRSKVLCQSIEIEQVFLNLINNAIDALNGQPIKLIEVEIQENSTSLQCRVSDSGLGVPVEMRKRIFEPFFTSKPAGKGTGLGLSIVKDILNAHNAEISYSLLGGKSSFILTFPKLESEKI